MVSEELLTTASARQARRAVRAFAPATVHVVVTARDLGQVIGSVWQQELAKGHTWSWPEFLTAVGHPELQQDHARIADRRAGVLSRPVAQETPS